YPAPTRKARAGCQGTAVPADGAWRRLSLPRRMNDALAATPRLQSSIRNKLTFLFFCVTADAMLIVYFYVVPQLESNLTTQKVDALKREANTNNDRYTRIASSSNLSI